MSEGSLSDEDREALLRMRRTVEEAKADGRWQSEPYEEDETSDKFEGPIGADADGNIVTYATMEEAQQAIRERERRQSGA